MSSFRFNLGNRKARRISQALEATDGRWPYSRPVRVGAALGAVALVALAPGCVSFKAVKSTGALASGLSNHVDSIAYVETTCTAIHAATAIGDDPGVIASSLDVVSHPGCNEIGDDAEAWANVIGSLVGYGKLLEGIASSKTVDLAAPLEGVRTGLAGLDVDALGTDEAKSAVKAASAVVGLIIEQLKRRALAKTVRDADPSIQEISKQLDKHIDQQLQTLRRLQDNLLNPAQDFIAPKGSEDVVVCKAPDGTELDCDAKGLRLAVSASLFAFDGWIAERSLALQRLKKAVKAFAAAHSVLARNATSLGKEDAAHLAAIIKAVKEVYENIEEAASSDDDDDDEQ